MKVICKSTYLDPNWFSISVGETYTVLDTAISSGDDTIYYDIRLNSGSSICWIPSTCFISLNEFRDEKIDDILNDCLIL